jgi:TM2 domain-containing membrane protein YozV
MKCYVHPEAEAVGICAACHKAICNDCLVEVEDKAFCRNCLAYGKNKSYQVEGYDPNTAFLVELVAGLFGLLGLGYIYVGETSEGLTRLLLFMLYNVVAWISIMVLSMFVVGLCLVPIQIMVQIGVAIWSADSLKKRLMA